MSFFINSFISTFKNEPIYPEIQIKLKIEVRVKHILLYKVV